MVRFRVNGKHRRTKLGDYPHVGLADARVAARDALAMADKGEDPGQERADKKAGGNSFREMAEEVLEARRLRTRERTQQERKRILEAELLPSWDGRPVTSITRREVVQLVERIAQRAPVLANRVLALVRLIFNDGIRRGFPGMEANPAHLVEPPSVEGSRNRYLKEKELRVIWTATESEGPLTRAAFRLTFLTAQRVGSVLAMRWDGIQKGLWTIPAQNFKGKRIHLVPLSPEAIEVVEELSEVRMDDTWVFPARANTKKPHLTNLASAVTRVRKATKLPHWTLHDARTTFRTHATRAAEDRGLGVAANVADATLATVLQTELI